MPVLCAVEVPKHALESYHMLIAQVLDVLAENADGICNNGLSGSHRIHKVSEHRLVYGRIAGSIAKLPLVKLHCHWCGNWPGLVHSELRQDRPNVAVLMDVNLVKLQIAFDVHAEIEGDTPKIIYPEPPLHLSFDLPNRARVSNGKEIIDVWNDCGNNCAMILLDMEHEQSSVDAWCHQPNRDHKVLKSAIPNVRILRQAIMRISEAEYHLPRSLSSWIVVSAPILEQTKIFLHGVHIYLIFQGNSQERRAYVHLMDLNIVLGGDCECQPNEATASSRCICSLVIDAFDLVICSTDYPGLELLHIDCSFALDLLYPVTWHSISPFRKLHKISKDMMQTDCI